MSSKHKSVNACESNLQLRRQETGFSGSAKC